MINNKEPIPVYTIYDIIEPFTRKYQLNYCGEFYIDEFTINQFGCDIKFEAGFYTRQLVKHLVINAHMPYTNIKWFIRARQTLKPDTFTKFLTYIFDTFPEAQAKLLANGFIGDLGRKYNRVDRGYTCRSMDTVQAIWTAGLADGKNTSTDNYKNPLTDQELFLVRER